MHMGDASVLSRVTPRTVDFSALHAVTPNSTTKVAQNPHAQQQQSPSAHLSAHDLECMFSTQSRASHWHNQPNNRSTKSINTFSQLLSPNYHYNVSLAVLLIYDSIKSLKRGRGNTGQSQQQSLDFVGNSIKLLETRLAGDFVW